MGSATSSFDLIERIKRGDREAFNPLFERYRPRLAVLILYKLSPQMRALVEIDDLVQDTLLKAYKELDQFDYRGPGSFFRWLSRVAEHVIIDAARYVGREKRHAVEMLRFRSASNPDGPDPADTKTPSRMLARSEALQHLMQELDKLPEQYREVILLAKIEGLDSQGVADRIGKSREDTALLLHRALKRFRQMRKADGEK